MNKLKTAIAPEGRICTKCCQFKVWEEFYDLEKGVNGKQSQCKKCVGAASLYSYHNKEGIKKSYKTYNEGYKTAVIKYYGGPVCVCCGETHMQMLTIDHTDNNGKEHREEMGKNNFYQWLVKQGFPDVNLQVLCYNCNFGKYKNGGVCPHKDQVKNTEETS